jgi:hypothetical protein
VRSASQLIVSGGEIDALATVFDTGTLTLTNGSIAPRARWYDATYAEGVIRVLDSGTVNLRGGEFFGPILQEDTSVVNIYGHSFLVEGELPTASGAPSGVRIQGFYANGNPLDVSIFRDVMTSRDFLHVVPEPNTGLVCLYVFGLVFIGFRKGVRTALSQEPI